MTKTVRILITDKDTQDVEEHALFSIEEWDQSIVHDQEVQDGAPATEYHFKFSRRMGISGAQASSFYKKGDREDV